MLTKILVLSTVAAFVSACDQAWPNGTDTTLHWFPSCTSAITFQDLKPQDASGNPEYPIKLTEPLVIVTKINNPKHTYTAGNLKQTLNLWSWGGWAGCKWSEVPTMGLLKDLDACTNGIPCPVNVGQQTMKVTLDFTAYAAIIKLLKDDSPYQLEMILNDSVTGDQSCVIAQARARTH